MEKKKRKKKKRKSNGSLSDHADRYLLYQQAVQCPEAEVSFFLKAYRHAYGTSPDLLREDFCGTAAVACDWVRSEPQRRVYGVDLDPEPLRWGISHNVARLKPRERERLELIEGDVLTVSGPPVDVVAAQNFSFFVFKERPLLIDYFRTVHRNLGERGIVVLDMFGGPDSLTEDLSERREFDGFDYVWEQRRFDPITHHCKFHIHFEFGDGSALRRAFSYDWRWWSIPEVREMLASAGFSRSQVYWEGTDPETGDGNGRYRRQAHAPQDPAWVCYVVGIK